VTFESCGSAGTIVVTSPFSASSVPGAAAWFEKKYHAPPIIIRRTIIMPSAFIYVIYS
jgi:hypothetical protein